MPKAYHPRVPGYPYPGPGYPGTYAHGTPGYPGTAPWGPRGNSRFRAISERCLVEDLARVE
eukprot:2957728-Rhodomonas_salina.1